MAEYIEQGIFRISKSVGAESFAAVVGQMEGDGPLGYCFDKVVADSHFGQETWEKAESRAGDYTPKKLRVGSVTLDMEQQELFHGRRNFICNGNVKRQS